MNHRRPDPQSPVWRPTDSEGRRWELWIAKTYVGRVLRPRRGPVTAALVERDSAGRGRFSEWPAPTLRTAARLLYSRRSAAFPARRYAAPD